MCVYVFKINIYTAMCTNRCRNQEGFLSIRYHKCTCFIQKTKTITNKNIWKKKKKKKKDTVNVLNHVQIKGPPPQSRSWSTSNAAGFRSPKPPRCSSWESGDVTSVDTAVESLNHSITNTTQWSKVGATPQSPENIEKQFLQKNGKPRTTSSGYSKAAKNLSVTKVTHVLVKPFSSIKDYVLSHPMWFFSIRKRKHVFSNLRKKSRKARFLPEISTRKSGKQNLSPNKI